MYNDSEERKAIEGFDEALRDAQTLIEVMAKSSRTLTAILDVLKSLLVLTTLGLGVAVGVLISIAWG